jgi:serine/threonine protein kinase/WD40 repeat protein
MTESSSLELLLSRALEFEGAAERSGFLDLACAGDGGLRREVESLVEAHLAADSFLLPRIMPDRGPPAENPGDRIGRYRLCEMIGEGGFGRVWMAEQQEPVRRMVALKIVKLGMDTREVLARFKVERQALALMDHPHIARVYDGGATDSGRPYFVMELVKGTPVTKYCADHQLGIRQRLELFLDVVAAVQHAHQKGIIHRDLKPSNILVCTQDGRPVVKVIDFGIAKAVSMELTGTTVMTAFGRMIGTPEYMSPEQAELNVLDVDTRSDIYSLGVVLYELLTGSTPLDPAVLRKAGFTEMQRMIREDKILKPSSRIVLNRKADGAVPGDGMIGREMDWVVMQALEKERSRRYQTANGLGMDVRRILDDEPVSASPPSATYRIAKFAKRHRAAAVWSIVFLAFVLSAAIGMTALYFDARGKEQVAREQTAAAEIERTKAVEAGKLAQSRTWEARVSQAAALRWSGKPERRFQAFDAIREAAAMTSEREVPGNMKRLRESTIANLSIVDMQPVDSWKGNPGYGDIVAANPALTRYANTFPDGRITIHRYPDHGIQREIPGDGRPVKWVLRFSPDGNRLAAAYLATDGTGWTMKLWNAGGNEAPVDLGPGIHKAFAFFPDGRQCLIGRPDGSLAVVDLASGKQVRSLALTGVPHSLAVSRQGKWIAVSIAAGETSPTRLEILDAESGRGVATLDCPVLPVAWSPTDDSLAAGGADHRLRVWHDEDWTSPPLELEGHNGVLDSVAWSPDGRLLATQAWDGTMRLWDPFQGTALSWHPGRGSHLGFSADGTRLGMVREGETVTLMEVEPGDVCYRGRKHSGSVGVFDGAWNPTGTLLATTGDDGVRLWNREGRQIGLLHVPRARGVSFTDDSLIVASVAGLHRWRITEAAEADGLLMKLHAPEPLGSFSSCEQIALPTGRDLPPEVKDLLVVAGRSASGNDGPAIWLLDRKGTVPPRRIEAPAGVANCAISADGQWFAAGTSKGNGVRVWQTRDPSAPVDLPIHGNARVAFSPDGKWLVTGDTEAYRFWKTGSWKLDREIPSQMGEFNGLMSFSPRMTALIIACRRAELKVLNPFTLEELASPDFDRESPLCFDPYGRVMITSGPSGGVFFWKLDTIRSRLDDLGLDWEYMQQFPPLELPVVRRVSLPGAGF